MKTYRPTIIPNVLKDTFYLNLIFNFSTSQSMEDGFFSIQEDKMSCNRSYSLI